MLLAAGGVLLLAASAVAVLKPLPAGVFALAAARFIASGISELGGGTVPRHIAGVVGLLIVGVAARCVLAFISRASDIAPSCRPSGGGTGVKR